MSSTRINVEAVLGLSNQITSAINLVSNVSASFNEIQCQIDGRILNRNDLRNRMQSVSAQLSDVNMRMQHIRSVVETGANRYYNVDRQVVAWGKALINNSSGQEKVIGAGSVLTGAYQAYLPLEPEQCIVENKFH